MGITGNLQLGGGGGISDISDAYTVGNSAANVVAGDSPYTVTETGSVILYVDSSAGAITINPIASPAADDRLKVVDVGGAALTNNITVTNIGTINTDNGSVEGRYSGSAWQLLESDTATINPQVEAGTTAPNAPTNQARFFLDSEKDNILSVIDESGNVYIIDEFVDTNVTTLALLESTYPAADYLGKKAIVAGTTSQNGGFQSDGTSWVKIFDEIGDPNDMPSYSSGLTDTGLNEFKSTAGTIQWKQSDDSTDVTLSGGTLSVLTDGNNTNLLYCNVSHSDGSYLGKKYTSASLTLRRMRFYPYSSALGTASSFYVVGWTGSAWERITIESVDQPSGTAALSANEVVTVQNGNNNYVDILLDITTAYQGHGIEITEAAGAGCSELEGHVAVDNTALVTATSEIKQLHAGYSKTTENTALTSDTLLDDDDYIVELDSSGGAFTMTLPAVATVKTGKRYIFKIVGTGTNAVTLDGDGSETIDGSTTNAEMDAQYDAMEIVSNGTEWHILWKNIA